MNRRQFLQSLAAFGATIALPFEAIATAADPIFEKAWAAAQEAPTIFYVNEYGALSADAVETFPATRKELLDYQEVVSREELLRSARETGSVGAVLECELSDPAWFADNEPVPDNWEDWLTTADEGTVSLLIDRVNDWINDSPDESDYENADITGYSGRGQALRFFRDECAANDTLNIVVVEGDCPGSSYFAAELRMPIEDANLLAAEEGLPIRFAVQG